MKTISLIGSTGSIGRQVCNVVRRHSEKFTIESIVANASSEAFLSQVREFKPKYAALVDVEEGKKIAGEIPDGVRFAYGEEAALAAVEYGETAFIAATGFAGLAYSLKAVACGKDVALANKETLVCGGELVMNKIKGAGIRLMPVDSEHSALWQALSFRTDAPFSRLIITASGGPFYGWDTTRLQGVTPASALKHPTWQMGAKITIDSATLLNKGFEVIEAKWLYNTTLDKIHTVVQPESIIHSMVEFADGGVLAQMSYPSMELPIQLALTYPNRFDCGLKPLDFAALGAIRFLPLERKAFPCFDLALTAAEKGDNYPCALNGAGEVAVRAFLEENIAFTEIAEIIAAALDKTERMQTESYAILKETDAQARAYAKEAVEKFTKAGK
ncbi:MAG: 1-deoxy-D-xylulose-5-phosphate reductoisomerase [Clostridiales bacterium]|nr:1-deoxy-D-xylulose-5-phosphate reductoisomerase [Clostridiales bacterium]